MFAEDSALGCVNIALIKYWGKEVCKSSECLSLLECRYPHYGCERYDAGCNFPINDSISITLDNDALKTLTKVEICVPCDDLTVEESYTGVRDEFILNGEKLRVSQRYRRILHLVRLYLSNCKLIACSPSSYIFRIITWNRFPTAAGLASSASGASAFAGAIIKLCRKIVLTSSSKYQLPHKTVLARFASGSGCRSMCDGFVHWVAEKNMSAINPMRSCAVSIAPFNHWPTLIIFCVVFPPLKNTNLQKSVSSEKAMRLSLKTSKLCDGLDNHSRMNSKDIRICELKRGIAERDFAVLAQITMQESDELHKICETCCPPVHYLNDFSRTMIDFVRAYNDLQHSPLGKQLTKLAYSFDAGPNAFLFCEEQQSRDLYYILRSLFPGTKNISCIVPDHLAERSDTPINAHISALIGSFAKRFQSIYEEACDSASIGMSECNLFSLYYAVPGQGVMI